MSHRLQPPETMWSRLRRAGIVLVLVMGLVLMALALGAAIGMRVLQ